MRKLIRINNRICDIEDISKVNLVVDDSCLSYIVFDFYTDTQLKVSFEDHDKAVDEFEEVARYLGL